MASREESSSSAFHAIVDLAAALAEGEKSPPPQLVSSRKFVDKYDKHLGTLFGLKASTKSFNLVNCTDEGFKQLVAARAGEFLGQNSQLGALPVYFVKACYAEYFLGRNMEYPRILERAIHWSSSDSGQENQDDLSKLAPLDKISSLFDGRKAVTGTSRFHIRYCRDTSFKEFLYRCAGDFQMDSRKLPVNFVQACYVHHFLGIQVDFQRLVENEQKTVKQPGFDSHEKRRKRKRHCKKCSGYKKKLQEAETRCKKTCMDVEKTCKDARLQMEKLKSWNLRRLLPSQGKLEELSGGSLSGQVFDDKTRKMLCPLCGQRFTGEGWYTVGSCGHQYHLQCLMLHSFCDNSCLVCKVPFLPQLSRTICNENI